MAGKELELQYIPNDGKKGVPVIGTLLFNARSLIREPQAARALPRW